MGHSVRIFLLLAASSSFAQVLVQRPPVSPAPDAPKMAPSPAHAAAIRTVPVLSTDTVLRITLDQEVRLRHEGQAVHGIVTEPVYANDKLIIPAGAEAIGTVVNIAPVGKKVRTLAALNADFAPAHKVEVRFDHVRLASGKLLPVQTTVSADQGGVLQLVTVDDKKPSKTEAARNAATKKIAEARQELKRQWNDAKAQLESPGKMHRLERRAMEELPYRPQYLEKGTSFTTDLLQPVAVDTVAPETAVMVPPVAAKVSAGITTKPDLAENLIHAALKTPLNSATSKPGDPVEAVLTRPLYAAGKLIYPAGVKLEGTVVQVRAARNLHRNGLLRIRFERVTRPGEAPMDVDSDLQGVEVSDGEQLKLDAEGGAEARTPKTRYAAAALSIALAAAPMHREDERGRLEQSPPGSAAAASGASGYRLIGTVLSVASRSQVLSSSLGFYGAAASVYSHFLSRGRDVVYPKDMAMIISLREPEKMKQ